MDTINNNVVEEDITPDKFGRLIVSTTQCKSEVGSGIEVTLSSIGYWYGENGDYTMVKS